MERIGKTDSKRLSENELLCNWSFENVVFNKSYRSQWCQFLPYKNITGYQLAIVPDNLHNVVRFFLFLYGCEGRSGSKIVLSVCFRSKNDSDFSVICSDVCLDLEPSTEIFEIHSSHPMLFSCSAYNFELKLKLHKDLTPTSLLSNTKASLSEGKESNTICAIPSKNVQNIEYPKELIQDLRSLFTSGEMCDLNIRIGKDILRAHKLILSARSPVFKRMMEHDCLESSSNSITITDCLAPTFEKFLKYLYTGEMEDSTMDTVMSLYSLGDKYDVPSLREICSKTLQSKFSSLPFDDAANIVCDVLQVAERHCDSKLKDLATNFIVCHFPAVSNKQSWKDLMKSNFELLSEIFTLVATGLHNTVYKTTQS